MSLGQSMIDQSRPAAAQLPDPTASFEAQSDAIAQQILAGLNSGVPTPAVALPADPAVPVQVAPPEPIVPVTQQAPGPDVAKLLARLADLEEQVSSQRRAPEPQQQPVSAPGIDLRRLQLDAPSVLAEAGYDVTAITRQLVAHAMGDQAPQELRAQVAVGSQLTDVNRQITALTGQVQTLQNQLRMSEMQTEYSTATAGVDSSQHPAVAAMARSNPEWLKKAFRELVTADARENLSRPDAQPLPAAEALKRLEARLAPLYAAFAPPAAPTATAGTTAAPTAAQVPATPSALGGAPSPVAPVQALSWEQKADAVLDDVLKKYGINK